MSELIPYLNSFHFSHKSCSFLFIKLHYNHHHHHHHKHELGPPDPRYQRPLQHFENDNALENS